MGGAINLGKIFGIQFRLHYTWFFIFVLITVSLSWQYFPSFYPGWGAPTYWVTGIFTSLLFFSSVVAHELAHSLVGRANGIPVRSITLFIFGGVAHMTREAARHSAELKMAAAGPISSLVIGGLFFLLHLLLGGISEPIAAMTFWLAQINVVLAVFNLIPGFPLDGGRVFRSLLWRFSGDYQRATRIAARVGQGIGYLFIGGGIILMFLFSRQWFNGLWLAFIGWFLTYVAAASYRQTQYQLALEGVTAAEMMTSTCPVVSPEVTVSHVVQEYISAIGHRCFLVAEDGELKGILTLGDIKSVGRPDWEITRVRNIMTPVEKLKVAFPEQDVLSMLEQMEEYNINQMPVVSEGRVVGLVTRDGVARFLRTRSELRV
ncbi:MAG TPA: CBS domain-containing protein [Dehalococcoidia bacterium]|jgi:Zn-dependent protease|nr:CBS domain-containing protein [Dehalococcoidia bacterium]